MEDGPLPLVPSAPELNRGRRGPELAFLHANAYPPQCYRGLLDAFAQDFRIRVMRQRPLWETPPAASLKSWHALSSDFLKWLRSNARGPMVAIGHSMGAVVALRAALRDPAPFLALFLIDPVLLTTARVLALRLRRHLGLGHPFQGSIQRAEKRRSVFGSVDEVFAAYRPHPRFRQLADDRLKQFVERLVQSKDGGVELRYSPARESRIYATAVFDDGDLWTGLHRLSVATLIIRGANSDTLTQGACSAAQAANTRIQVATVEQATHLVPFERPLEVRSLAQAFLRVSLAGRRAGHGVAAPDHARLGPA